MPTNVLTEKDYQKYIINKLINDNGYILRKIMISIDYLLLIEKCYSIF